MSVWVASAAGSSWFPNSVERETLRPARGVESDPSVFPIEASFSFELRQAQRNPGAFEARDVEAARRELAEWEAEGDGRALLGATHRFNLATRLLVLGTIRADDHQCLDEAIQLLRAAETGAEEGGDGPLAAKIQSSLGRAVFEAARKAGDVVGLQESMRILVSAASSHEALGQIKECGHARYNLGLASTAIANRTGRVFDFRQAEAAFRGSATQYAALGDLRECATAQFQLGLIQLELGRRTGERDALAAAAMAFADAVAGLSLPGDDARLRADAWNNRAIALVELGELQTAVPSFAAAAAEYVKLGSTLEWANARFREGHALADLARETSDATWLRGAIDALAEAAKGYREVVSIQDLSSALHNRSVCLLELADRSGSHRDYAAAAAAFAESTKTHIEVGHKENGAVTEYYRGVALLQQAGLENALDTFRDSANASATAATVAKASSGGEEWYANARFNQGLALLEAARRTARPADSLEAARVLDEAVNCLQSVGHAQRASEAQTARDAALERSAQEAPLAVDTDIEPVAGSVGGVASTRNKGAGVTAQSSTPVSAIDTREAFTDAVSAAQAAVRLVARDLEARLDAARRFVPARPEDRVALIEDVAMAAALGLVVRVDGREAKKLVLKDGSLAWSLMRGGHLGFKKNQAKVDFRTDLGQGGPSPK